jgi:hypothetical protein
MSCAGSLSMIGWSCCQCSGLRQPRNFPDPARTIPHRGQEQWMVPLAIRSEILHGLVTLQPAHPLLRRNTGFSIGGLHATGRIRPLRPRSNPRPLIRAAGADIELLEVHRDSVRAATRMCSGCPSAHMTLYMGVGMALPEEIEDLSEPQLV